MFSFFPENFKFYRPAGLGPGLAADLCASAITIYLKIKKLKTKKKSTKMWQFQNAINHVET